MTDDQLAGLVSRNRAIDRVVSINESIHALEELRKPFLNIIRSLEREHNLDRTTSVINNIRRKFEGEE